MKNALESTNRAGQAKERIGELKDRNKEMTQLDKDRKLRVKKERTLQELSNSIRKSNIKIMVYQRRGEGTGNREIKQMINENLPNL